MKKSLLAATAAMVVVLALSGQVSARPQLVSPSIGWIDPSDITCEETSDHLCVVRDYPDEEPLAFTHQGPKTQGNDISPFKYRVPSGTQLVILDAGTDNEPTYDEKNNTLEYPKAVEVGIMVPSDWDAKGNLRPLKPCHLQATGQSPQIVSLKCGGDVATKVSHAAERPSFNYIPLGWVFTKYLNCSAENNWCYVADPTGTPLNIRTRPAGNKTSSILNGVPITVLDRIGDWSFIAVITGDMSGQTNLACEVFTNDMGAIGCQKP